jgi:hypothetical protein
VDPAPDKYLDAAPVPSALALLAPALALSATALSSPYDKVYDIIMAWDGNLGLN